MQQNPELTSISRFKLTSSNPDSIHKNPLNTSSSKMQYSIPKSKRWQDQKSTSHMSKFYDLPQLKEKRSTSFGYGNKIDLSKKNLITPSPHKYQIKREFQIIKGGYTIGYGRQKIKNVSIFNQRPYKIPGPGNYQVNMGSVLEKTPTYSVKGKYPDLSQKWKNSVPGPGNYTTIELVKNNNKIMISNFQSSPASTFSKEKRLSQYQIRTKITKVPGPGQYKVDKNQHLIQMLKTHGGQKFGKSQRQGICEKKITPGPGAYNHFSDFIY